MMYMRMQKSTKKRLKHGMTSTSSEENLNPNNKFSSSIQGFVYSLESSSQDALDHSLSCKYFHMGELKLAIQEIQGK